MYLGALGFSGSLVATTEAEARFLTLGDRLIVASSSFFTSSIPIVGNFSLRSIVSSNPLLHEFLTASPSPGNPSRSSVSSNRKPFITHKQCKLVPPFFNFLSFFLSFLLYIFFSSDLLISYALCLLSKELGKGRERPNNRY